MVKKIVLRVSESQIEQASSWTIKDGEPPFSISQVYQAAKTWVKDKYSRYDDVEIDGIRIQPHGCSMHNNKWLYVVDFNPTIDGNKLWGSGNWAAVLMDGTIVGPVTE